MTETWECMSRKAAEWQTEAMTGNKSWRVAEWQTEAMIGDKSWQIAEW